MCMTTLHTYVLTSRSHRQSTSCELSLRNVLTSLITAIIVCKELSTGETKIKNEKEEKKSSLEIEMAHKNAIRNGFGEGFYFSFVRLMSLKIHSYSDNRTDADQHEHSMLRTRLEKKRIPHNPPVDKHKNCEILIGILMDGGWFSIHLQHNFPNAETWGIRAEFDMA